MKLFTFLLLNCWNVLIVRIKGHQIVTFFYYNPCLRSILLHKSFTLTSVVKTLSQLYFKYNENTKMFIQWGRKIKDKAQEICTKFTKNLFGQIWHNMTQKKVYSIQRIQNSYYRLKNTKMWYCYTFCIFTAV